MQRVMISPEVTMHDIEHRYKQLMCVEELGQSTASLHSEEKLSVSQVLVQMAILCYLCVV